MLEETRDKLAARARTEQSRYAGEAERPLRGYVITMAAYAGLVSGLAGTVKLTRRQIPDGLSAADVVVCAAATHKLSRLIAKDPVTSPLRAPFTTFRGTSGPSELKEDVRGRGGQKAVGELVTCPFCTSVWLATGLAAGLIYAPRATRLGAGLLAALAGADMLQFVHAWLQKTSS